MSPKSIALWITVGLVGAIGWAVLALSRGEEISAAALHLLDLAAPLIRTRGITLVGVALTGLASDEFYQMVLPLDGPDHSGLDAALDGVSARFGSSAIRRGSLLRSGEGFAAPQLG